MKQGKGENKNRPASVEEKVLQLLKREPTWGQILRACVAEAKRTKNNFAGAWVFWALKQQGIKTPTNLRKLTGLKVLIKTGSARGGKRAYYSVSNIALLERIVKEFSS